MTPEVVQAPEPEPPRMSAFARITGVFFEPGKTFADIGRRPDWLPPVLVLALATLAVTYVMSHRIGMEQIIRLQGQPARDWNILPPSLDGHGAGLRDPQLRATHHRPKEQEAKP